METEPLIPKASDVSADETVTHAAMPGPLGPPTSGEPNPDGELLTPDLLTTSYFTDDEETPPLEFGCSCTTLPKLRTLRNNPEMATQHWTSSCCCSPTTLPTKHCTQKKSTEINLTTSSADWLLGNNNTTTATKYT